MTNNRKSGNRVTIKDVAKLAGVSPATVGRVIGNYGSVSVKTRNKVLEAIKELNYTPDIIAQSMKGKKTKTIGLIISNILNPFFGIIARAVEDTANKYKYNLIICNTDENMEKEISYIKTLISKRVDGLLISSSYVEGTKYSKELLNLYNNEIPKVFIDRKLEQINAPTVSTDSYEGAYKATSYLVRLGHKRIGIIIGTPKVKSIYERIRGYKDALVDNNIPVDPDLIVDGGNVQVEGGMKACEQLLSNREKSPTALLAVNSLLTTGALLALNKLNIKIPENISVVGWDDFELATILNPPLTVVSQPTYAIGTIATEKLVSIISGNEISNLSEQDNSIVLKTSLIVRESCTTFLKNDDEIVQT